jgi:hypothetical protein
MPGQTDPESSVRQTLHHSQPSHDGIKHLKLRF